jgi:serine/threonine protein kinase
VSAQNLILAYEVLVKVLDFGIAKADHRQSQTRTGLVKGKFSYMSPEQCQGHSLDRRNDVFALGIVLFELCTARRLFKRGSTYQTYTAITNADVPPPRTLNPKIPAEVEAVILRALAKKRDDRFASADAMQDALEDAMRKTSLRGSATDLAKFMNETFAAEEAEQRRLILQAQKGELGAGDEAAQLSPVAAAAAAEMASNYVVDNERTSVDLLPPLAEDSGRNWKADPDTLNDGEFDSQENVKTRAQSFPKPPPPPASQETTQPRGVPSLRGQIPTIYYLFAVLSVMLIVLIAWLIAR